MSRMIAPTPTPAVSSRRAFAARYHVALGNATHLDGGFAKPWAATADAIGATATHHLRLLRARST